MQAFQNKYEYGSRILKRGVFVLGHDVSTEGYDISNGSVRVVDLDKAFTG